MNNIYKYCVFALITFFVINSNAQNLKVDTVPNKDILKKQMDQNNDPFVFDYEKILSKEEVLLLESKLMKSKVISVDEILIVTTPSIGDFNSILAYGRFVLNIYQTESKKQNIILIAVSKSQRQAGIVTSEKMKKNLTDIECAKIIEETMVKCFKKNEFYNGITYGLDEIIKVLKY